MEGIKRRREFEEALRNVLAKLDLEADTNGDLYILPPTWSPNANGVVGYGRYLNV